MKTFVHDILQKAQGTGGGRYRVEWQDTIVRREHLASLEKDGLKTESHRRLSDDDFAGIAGYLPAEILHAHLTNQPS